MEKEMLISEDKLENVLLRNKEKIGTKKIESVDRLLASASFLMTVIFATFKFDLLKYWIGFLGIGYSAYGFYILINTIFHPYTHEDLLNEIKDIDQIEHEHSIIAIKNTWDEYPNKFLIYYDKRWDCDFFLNCQTINDVDNMENVIKDKVSSALRINKESIQAEYKGYDISRKYSVSNKKYKTYNHRFYLVTINKYPEEEKSDFFIDGVQYKWLTIEEMRNNENTYKKNSDVINKVDELM